MQEYKFFNSQALQRVEKAVSMAEELVNDFFNLSSGHWLKNWYDIKTARDLSSHERVTGPFAQVVKYEGHKEEVPLGSSSFSLYKVCVQDMAILKAVEREKQLLLDPFLLYVLTHELVHVARFLRFEQRYENAGEADLTLAEERKVHDLTHLILCKLSIKGLSNVFIFYKRWREGPGDTNLGKNIE